MSTRTKHTVLLAIPASLLTAAWLIAGPLSPPAGPVAGTYKTLAEVEPRIAINATNTPGSASYVYEISQPGSYYLTQNLTGASGMNGIRVTVSGVTIDLNGFSMRGLPGSLDGIVGHPVGNTNVAVINGTVESWGSDGINLYTNSGIIRLEGITVRICGGRGLMVGLNSIVKDCAVFSCGDDGILTGEACVVSNCSVRACDANGISVSAGSTVSRCTTSLNDGSGISGYIGATITGCTAMSNGFSGIYGGTAAVISDCTSRSNIGDGFTASPGSILTNCNAGDNGGSGFEGTNITVVTCRASSNTGAGIDVGDWSVARDCSAIGNTDDGMLLGSHCRIADNHCYGNGAGSPVSAAIHAVGTDNRIEGNHCEGADVGVDVDTAGNYIVRNSCTGNTIDWSFAANNVYGPIIDRRAPGSPLIFGFTAAGTITSSDPHANISH